jgi:hypothetical protein
MKGTFLAKSFPAKLERAYAGLFDVRWPLALYAVIRWQAKGRFRFFHSGNFQGRTHFLNVVRICAATRDVPFWIPTREAALVCENAGAIPGNAVVRVSGNVLDGPPPGMVADDQHPSSPTLETRRAQVRSRAGTAERMGVRRAGRRTGTWRWRGSLGRRRGAADASRQEGLCAIVNPLVRGGATR